MLLPGVPVSSTHPWDRANQYNISTHWQIKDENRSGVNFTWGLIVKINLDWHIRRHTAVHLIYNMWAGFYMPISRIFTQCGLKDRPEGRDRQCVACKWPIFPNPNEFWAGRNESVPEEKGDNEKHAASRARQEVRENWQCSRSSQDLIQSTPLPHFISFSQHKVITGSP